MVNLLSSTHVWCVVSKADKGYRLNLGVFMLPTIQVKAGTVIFKEGGNDKTMFIVLSGSVQIYIERNQEDILFAVINKYDFFGEIALYRNHPRNVAARVLTDATLVIVKNQVELEQFITKNSVFSGKMMVIMANRLDNINHLFIEKIEALSTTRVDSSECEHSVLV